MIIVICITLTSLAVIGVICRRRASELSKLYALEDIKTMRRGSSEAEHHEKIKPEISKSTLTYSCHGAIALTGGAIGFYSAAFPGAIIGAVSAGYGLILFSWGYKKFKTTKAERAVLSELPVLLESLILLVESGLGILPAIDRLIKSNSRETKNKNVRYYLAQVLELSMRGVPFAQALQSVADNCPYPALRHFFLHLDIGANVGGKLGNSLRSLAQHSHQEWRLSVEARVRRLENFVVFPVFGSVIGLILATAAVPLIPLLDLKDKLDASQVESAAEQTSDIVGRL